jgi:hypothetical protein
LFKAEFLGYLNKDKKAVKKETADQLPKNKQKGKIFNKRKDRP